MDSKTKRNWYRYLFLLHIIIGAVIPGAPPPGAFEGGAPAASLRCVSDSRLPARAGRRDKEAWHENT
jgi:hypothetical protein